MLTIEGEKYRGYFIGDMYRYESSDYEGFDYRGTGMIEGKAGDEKILFHFTTPFFKIHEIGDYYLDLERTIVHWRQEHMGSTAYVIVSYPKIVDLLLEDLLKQSERSKSLIPFVGTGILTEKDLLRRGLLALPEGQMVLPVGKNLFPQASS